MHLRPFAHASPNWNGKVGSTDPEARAQAAADLLRAIAASKTRASEAYGEIAMPRLDARFEAAKQKLEAFLPDAAE
jgi:TolB protein